MVMIAYMLLKAKSLQHMKKETEKSDHLKMVESSLLEWVNVSIGCAHVQSSCWLSSFVEAAVIAMIEPVLVGTLMWKIRSIGTIGNRTQIWKGWKMTSIFWQRRKKYARIDEMYYWRGVCFCKYVEMAPELWGTFQELPNEWPCSGLPVANLGAMRWCSQYQSEPGVCDLRIWRGYICYEVWAWRTWWKSFERRKIIR